MIEAYAPYTNEETIRELELLAKELKDIKVLHVNSTKEGGGVAEILTRLVPLMNELGIKTDWKVIKGDEEFFRTTKKIHNLLHMPQQETLESSDLINYLRTTYENLNLIDTENYDVVFIHDPQPMGLVVKKQKGQKWLWRCHIDTSTPDQKAWEFIEGFLNAYDAAVFHIPEFVYRGVKIPAFVIPPSIDPIHPKNMELKEEQIKDILERLGIDSRKPMLLQVSRFDRLKDPLGFYQAYKLVKKKYDCSFVLAGSFAPDDPEGQEVYTEVLNAAVGDKDVHVLNLPPTSHVEINALQRSATVVFQKSIREGFGLVVSEAMWKRKAVIGGNTGGIRRQIVDGLTGYLVNTVEGAAFRAKHLLADRTLREVLGENAKERVRHRFLITRHLKDWLLLMSFLLGSSQIGTGGLEPPTSAL